MADLHLFASDQPGLNWDSLAVREAVHDMMRFWLDKGIDGFRVLNHSIDVANFLMILSWMLSTSSPKYTAMLTPQYYSHYFSVEQL